MVTSLLLGTTDFINKVFSCSNEPKIVVDTVTRTVSTEHTNGNGVSHFLPLTPTALFVNG